MKKNIKILTLALSLLLIIGAVVGVTAFAANDTTVEIVRKNISYDGAVKTLYAIDAENIGKGKVAVQFYSVDPATEGAEPAYTKLASDKITLDGEEYDVVFSNGFRPIDLRASIWAVPVVIDGNSVVASGAAVEYSPYIYAMNRFDKEATGDQYALYTALLEYGAAVQRLLSTPEAVAANGGYADEYYEVTVKNALATDVANVATTTVATYSKADIDAGKAVASSKLGETPFVALANADGNPIKLDASITSEIVKPGRSSFVALYGSWAEVRVEKSDFATGNPSGFVETAHMIKTTPSTTKANFPANTPEAWKGSSSITDNTGALVHTKVITPLDVFDGDEKAFFDYNYQYWRLWFTSSATLEDISIVELDVKFTNFTGNGSIYATVGGAPKITITPSTELDENGYIKHFTLGNAILENDKSYNLRFEWFTDAGVMTVYVDGKVALVTDPLADDVERVTFTLFEFATGTSLAGVTTIDNLYSAIACIHSEYGANYINKDAIIAGGTGTFYQSCVECKAIGTETVKYTGTHNGGKYYNSALDGTRYDMNTVPKFSRASNENLTFSVNNGILNISSAAWRPNTIRLLNASGAESSVKLVAGAKFITEFDIMYTGHGTAVSGDDFRRYMGIASEADSNWKSSYSPDSSFWFNKDYYATMGPTTDGALAQNVWYNYRMEYALNSDGSAYYTAYLNDTVIDSGKFTTAATELFGWVIESRGGTPVTYSIDNMYMGVDCVGEHSFAENVANSFAYIGAGVFYKSCSRCGLIDTETFVAQENVALGTGTYFANRKIDGYRWDYSGTSWWIGTDANKGVLTGYSNKSYEVYTADTTNGYASINIPATDSWVWSTASLRPGYLQGFSGVEVKAGDKIVSEFDFIIRDGYKNASTGDCDFLKLSLSAKANGSDSGQFTPQICVTSQADGITSKLGTATIYEGVWYNLRMECTVGSDYAVYVNGELVASGTYTTAPASYKFYGPSIVTRANRLDMSFDNQFAAINPVEAE